MMTTVYFVRHAESDGSVSETVSRPLTSKGKADVALVTQFLSRANVTRILSSPYKRAIDTVSGYAQAVGKEIEIIDGFREWSGYYINPDKFFPTMKRMFNDFSLKEADGESFSELQKRNTEALMEAVSRYDGETIAIGTHGIALSVTLAGLVPSFGYDDFFDMCEKMPWIARLVFSDGKLCSFQAFDPVSPYIDDCKRNVEIAPEGELSAYRFVVIFARHNGKWVYCRAKTRDGFETAGGHIENGETPLAAAERELYEETGAADFDIRPLFDYSVSSASLPHGFSYGKVYLADVHTFGEMPPYEMAEIRLMDALPNVMRFPSILPVLYKRVCEITGLSSS